ncbi:hypothetical protein TVAG_352870 [Trichomonas vaginalis G3]|uniref:Uncharacterized protein n=1 Tax=Trichomonas vaginalis (strain ATCC PRA-98 / G3) TaxID=412133 RepID=A2EG89_TRIV3|nr:hypothetical protein TVAGG3_0134210 [Trichomonas vaginalis G3]EAY08365.1 hypothetical protein TVAG_352870 [Trichomonas vaginalis G3]KAI5546286.1 hypothetical protein TVAGG3_0134210 [Trichomonas vaginalis G3]|eukprot:XP_001320588.1 hypothetical protein [Trichomonas vaginalis G3]
MIAAYWIEKDGSVTYIRFKEDKPGIEYQIPNWDKVGNTSKRVYHNYNLGRRNLSKVKVTNNIPIPQIVSSPPTPELDSFPPIHQVDANSVSDREFNIPNEIFKQKPVNLDEVENLNIEDLF